MARVARARFDRLAEAVTERVTDLLRAPVVVQDDDGKAVASNEGGLNLFMAGLLNRDTPSYVRARIRAGDRAGDVLVGEPQGEEPISPRLAQVLVEMLINEAAVVDRLPNQHETKNRFIYDLLRGRIDDEDQMLSQARFLGMDLAPPRAVILIDAAEYLGPAEAVRSANPGADRKVHRQVQFIIGSVVGFFHLPNDTICAYIGDGQIAVLKASNTRNLANWVGPEDVNDEVSSSWANLSALKRAGNALLSRLRNDTDAPLSIGIGRYHPGLRGLAQSYRDARVALLLGRRFQGHNRVHCLDELGVAAFVGMADEKTKLDLAMHLLSPLDHEPELLATVDRFFATNCSPGATAGELSIHRNTLAYRLDKVKSLTGLDPRNFDDAVQIRLALVLRSLNGDGVQLR